MRTCTARGVLRHGHRPSVVRQRRRYCRLLPARPLPRGPLPATSPATSALPRRALPARALPRGALPGRALPRGPLPATSPARTCPATRSPASDVALPRDACSGPRTRCRAGRAATGRPSGRGSGASCPGSPRRPARSSAASTSMVPCAGAVGGAERACAVSVRANLMRSLLARRVGLEQQRGGAGDLGSGEARAAAEPVRRRRRSSGSGGRLRCRASGASGGCGRGRRRRAWRGRRRGSGPARRSRRRCRRPSEAVPWSSLAPTVMTHGSSPGLAIVPAPVPWLPAATTTVMPFAHTCSTARFSGSRRYERLDSLRSDRLTTSMPYVARLAMTHCSAASRSLTLDLPSRPESLTASEVGVGSDAVHHPGHEGAVAEGVGAAGLVERLRHGCDPLVVSTGTTAPASGATSAMPVSMTATVVPAPVRPSALAALEPIASRWTDGPRRTAVDDARRHDVVVAGDGAHAGEVDEVVEQRRRDRRREAGDDRELLGDLCRRRARPSGGGRRVVRVQLLDDDLDAAAAAGAAARGAGRRGQQAGEQRSGEERPPRRAAVRRAGPAPSPLLRPLDRSPTVCPPPTAPRGAASTIVGRRDTTVHGPTGSIVHGPIGAGHRTNRREPLITARPRRSGDGAVVRTPAVAVAHRVRISHGYG